MTIYKQLLIISFTAIICSSCNNKGVEFNNQLVKIQQQALPQVEVFAKKWSANVDSTNLKNIKPEAEKIVLLLDHKIGELNALPEYKNGHDLRIAILDQLTFEKDICSKLGRLGDSLVSDEEKEAIGKSFAASSQDAERVTKRVTETQKAFAAKDHFSLESK